MIICLTGMHRSGTSLMASYLNACGISMGESLLGAGRGNIHGHYEDMEFLEFHKGLLEENKADIYVCKKKLNVSQKHKKTAREMIENRNQRFSIWGWKEPRTTLFLEFWESLGYGIKYVFLYRDPFEVIESLMKRMKIKYLITKPWSSPGAWLRHNEELLRFYKKNKQKAIVININKFNKISNEGTKLLSSWLDYDLPKKYTDIFRPEDMNKSSQGLRKFYIGFVLHFIKRFYGKKLLSLHRNLGKHAALS